MRTRAHQSIAQIPCNALFGLTATPMWNRILDLYRYCSLLAGHLSVDFTDDDPTGGLPGPDEVRFADLRSLYKAWSDVTTLPEDFDEIPYELLNPVVLMRLTEDTGGEVTTQIGYEAYPFLFRACIMQRSMGDQVVDQNRQLVVIGSEIPPSGS
ncbi:hypothetical protein PMG11_01813 [Penicillium brasilianum]|uniref:SNF2 N-terminal domain-containing protein n=1 Tax=Penicillium brasilianum TaxID=104259 RepID=A0A0F7TJC8_PENBI|nr:hypothetical protein PMG11_01813 [Penicillium brasilianum]